MITVATTIPPWKIGPEKGYYAAWLEHAEDIRDSIDDEVRFLMVLELDGRGRDVFIPLFGEIGARLAPPDIELLTFTYEDGRETVTTGNRLVRICTGRNLITQWAVDHGASHVLFVDADTAIPGDSLPKLLEVGYPIVGGRVPTYCLEGPQLLGTDGKPLFPFRVTKHMNTAGFLLVERSLFNRLRWRTDPDQGLTDDPCYDNDAASLGFPTWVREDCVASHYPLSIGPVESRGHDLAVYR